MELRKEPHKAPPPKSDKDFAEYKKMLADQKLKPMPLPPPVSLKDVKLIVCARKRPLISKEKQDIDCVSVSNPTVRVHECGKKVDLTKIITNHDFAFDYAFGDQDSTDVLYSRTIKPLIPLLNDKGTITIFAYGQTGSGKTFTMEGVQKAAIADMFVLAKAGLTFSASYFEIYDGKVFDLLNKRKQLDLLEDANNIIQVVGLSEKEANSADKIMSVIEFGNKVRSTSSTVANDTSSRSHAICKIQIRKDKAVMGNLLLIDLAGSEKAQVGQANSRQRRLEGAEINKSLLALKECIRAIDMKGPHIPFRASKLTKVLRESFSGSSEKNKIVMIACVSPVKSSTGDTLNTLLYANRLKDSKPTIEKMGPQAPLLDAAPPPAPVQAKPIAHPHPGPIKGAVPEESVSKEQDDEPVKNKDLSRLMTTLMMEDKFSFTLLNAAEQVKRGHKKLVRAHENYLKDSDDLRKKEGVLAAKLKDLEKNDIDECVVEMEKLADERMNLFKKLTDQISMFKKKLHEEEESSRAFELHKHEYYNGN